MTTTADATEKRKRSRAKPAPPPADPPYTETEFNRLRELAVQIDAERRQPGQQRGGFLKPSGLEIYRAILTLFLQRQTAIIFTSIAEIAAAANCADSTTEDALKRLNESGLIERGPRFVRLGVRFPNAVID